MNNEARIARNARRRKLYREQNREKTLARNAIWRLANPDKQLRYPPEYFVWHNMRHRCRDPKNKCFGNYGGRGIKVCDQWSQFAAFLEDMGPRPSSKHSIDRLDNDGDYNPGNCRWATKTQQLNNRRGNRLLTYCGETHTVTEWARMVGIKSATLFARIRTGWIVEKALFVPTQRWSR